MTTKLLNRSALLLRPRQPLADWIARIAPEEALDLAELRAEGNVYLIDEAESESSFDEALEQHWRKMFENELTAWDEFSDDWPWPLTRELFDQWFEVEPQVMVFDISGEPLLRATMNSDADD